MEPFEVLTKSLGQVPRPQASSAFPLPQFAFGKRDDGCCTRSTSRNVKA